MKELIELEIQYLMDLINEHGRDSQIGKSAAIQLKKAIKYLCK